MKIIIDAAFGKEQLAGLEMWGVEFVRNLAKFDRENRYILYGYFWKNFRKRKESVYVPPQDNFSIRVSRIPRRVVDFLESRNAGIVDILAGCRDVDIFHGIGFFLPKLKKTKGIITVHGLDFKELDVTWYRDRWYKHFGLYLKRADRVIAVSMYVKEILVQSYGIDASTVEVIYPGIRNNFSCNTISAEKRHRPYIFCVATSVERKNLKRVLDAFASIKDKNKDVELVIAGDGKMLKDSLQMHVSALNLVGRVRFPGYLDEVALPEFYRGAECLVFPSLYEGLGLPIVEAMACGCPVITSNISAMPEIAGGAAILVDPFKTEDIAGAIDIILSSRQVGKEMREKGLERSSHFSWEKSISKTLELYRELSNLKFSR